MQKVVRVKHTVESYVQQNFHQRMRAPEECPQCHRYHRFQAHGYYERFATDRMGKVLRIRVRRFLCTHCARTLSCLPYFLQPYRLISNPTMEAFMLGEGQRLDVQRQAGLLQRYRQRFVSGWKTLAQLLGNLFGRAPPSRNRHRLLAKDGGGVRFLSRTNFSAGPGFPNHLLWNLSLSPTGLNTILEGMPSRFRIGEAPHTTCIFTRFFSSDKLWAS